jgi:hypothetical protein
MSMLRSSVDDLSDLAEGSPELVDETGERSSVRLRRKLGVGGMATVFFAERTGDPPSFLSPLTPQRLAVKFMQASTARELDRLGVDVRKFFARESVALARLSSRQPPTPYVVGFYGCGTAEISLRHGVRHLPFIALEYVDGGAAGASLHERVQATRGGVDPVRALRLVRGIVEGLSAIHEERLIHRDLKPDNVLVAGPVDDEIPKVTDYGITRVEGMETVVPGATLGYAGFEQLMTTVDTRNPLIGPWCDVHALAAVVWYVIGGEQWFEDLSWFSGVRRSLRAATRTHSAFAQDPSLLDALDAVLMRGAAPRLPAIALAAAGAESFHKLCVARYGSMSEGPERHADVASFAADLFPILERAAAAWTERAARESLPITLVRPTVPVASGGAGGQRHRIEELTARAPHPPDASQPSISLAAGALAFQADGRVLALEHGRLHFFVDDQPYRVVPPALPGNPLENVRWVVHAQDHGYALVGPRTILFVQGGKWRALDLPARPGRAAGEDVGDIQACIGARGRLVVVTAETDASDGGPELWRYGHGRATPPFAQAPRWSDPVIVPLNGDAHAMSEGAYGTLIVGSKGGKRARASFLSTDGAATVFATGVNHGPALRVATCGSERDAWAASDAMIVRFDRGGAETEHVMDPPENPVQLALDLVGVPWLVTDHAIHRREAGGTTTKWREVHRRSPNERRFVGIGFTPDGARVMDEAGGGVRVVPADVGEWRARERTA